MELALTRAVGAALLLGLSAAHAGVPNGPYSYLTVPNVTYGPAPLTGSEAQAWVSGNTLYECLPQPRAGQWQGPYPVIMFFHGGGWTKGHAGYDVPECQKWASYGFAAFAVNYRLQPSTIRPVHDGYPAPAQFVDTQLAIRWLRMHAAALHASGAQITCFGDSAGASLCEQAALYPGVMPSPGDPVVSMYSSEPSKVESFVAEFGPTLYGPAPLTSTLATQYAATAPASVIVQGSTDLSVPPANSQFIYNALVTQHRPSLYIAFVGGHEYAGVPDDVVTAIQIEIMRNIARHDQYFGFPVSSP